MDPGSLNSPTRRFGEPTHDDVGVCITYSSGRAAAWQAPAPEVCQQVQQRGLGRVVPLKTLVLPVHGTVAH